MSRSLFQRCLAEAAGTAILVGVGTGAIVGAAGLGGLPQWLLAFAWFGAVAVAVELFAYVSGSHINPVVTLGLVLAGRFPARRAPAYVGSQIAGAFLGSGLVLALLGSGAQLGATVPRNGAAWPAFPLEFGFTFALILSVLYLTAPGRDPPRWLLLLPAAVVGVSTLLIGPLTGSSLNPARTLSPAVLAGVYAGIWIYLIATPLAAVAAAALAMGTERLHPIASRSSPGT